MIMKDDLMANGQFSDSPSNHDNDRSIMASFQILRAIMIMIAKTYIMASFQNRKIYVMASFQILRAIMIMIAVLWPVFRFCEQS